MDKKKRLAGRFLPSRVYARWKWTVRFGLSALPLVLLLVGCVVIYLTPGRYQSTIVFEYLGKRPPADAAALLKTNQLINRAAKALELPGRMEIDSESVNEIVAHDLRVRVERGTGLIELKVTNGLKEVARDLATELTKALEAYEKSIATAALKLRMDEIRQTTRDGEDQVEEKLKNLTRIIGLTGGVETDALSQLEIDAARDDWDAARLKVRELHNQLEQAERDLANPGQWVTVVSQSSLSNSALKPESTLTDRMLRSLVVGLGFALLVPYLLELLFPQIYRPRLPKREEWQKETADTGLAELPT